MNASGLSSATEELLEQHPGLRLSLVPPDELHARHHSRRLTSHGAYELWRLFAANEAGDGLSLTIANGDPFAPEYRATVRKHRAGFLVDTARLRPSAFPTLRLSIYRARRLLARAADLYPANSFRERSASPADPAWSVSLGTTRLERTTTGWSLVADARPTALGRAALRRPGPLPGASINCELHITPALPDLTTLQRANLPDSPSGAMHDWLLVCPSARISGRICVTLPDQRPMEFFLDSASGSLDHFWGTGPLSESAGSHAAADRLSPSPAAPASVSVSNVRRWYRARMAWDRGAAVGELVILRRFIQLAGSIMIFRPGRVPAILRTERLRPPVYERAHWLIAYPLELAWDQPSASARLEHRVSRVADVQPHHVLAFTEARLEAGQPPDELIAGPLSAHYELFQPGRIDAPYWRPFVGPWPR